MIIAKECKVEECDGVGAKRPNGRRYLPKGYCNKHYLRLRIHGSLSRTQATNAGDCKVVDCSSPQHARNLCKIHYRRFIAHGSTTPTRHSNVGDCIADSCDSPQEIKNLCSMHYQRKKLGIAEITVFTRRPAVIEGDIAKIPLGINSKDGWAIVDKDFAWIDKHQWSLDSMGYPMTGSRHNKFRMHRMVMGKPLGLLVTDHLNRNKLDNRTSNLRFVTKSENSINTKLSVVNKSGYKNVHWSKKNERWIVQVRRKNIRYHIGSFLTQSEAVLERDKALSLV